MYEPLTLPAITSEKVEISLLSWSADVPDPEALMWRAALSSEHASRFGAAPEPSDAAWSDAGLVDRSTTSRHDYRVVVLVSGLPPGRYGVWVRVAGGTGGSPARFVGVLILR